MYGESLVYSEAPIASAAQVNASSHQTRGIIDDTAMGDAIGIASLYRHLDIDRPVGIRDEIEPQEEQQRRGENDGHNGKHYDRNAVPFQESIHRSEERKAHWVRLPRGFRITRSAGKTVMLVMKAMIMPSPASRPSSDRPL